MKVVILAGGLGSRPAEVTLDAGLAPTIDGYRDFLQAQ
jgi:dTDP-glucose pyrophosphorylase